MRFRHLFDDETSKRMILLEYSPLQPWMLNPRGLSLSNPYVPNIIWSWYLINSSRKFTWIPFFYSLRVESQQNLSDIFSTCNHYFTFKYCPFTTIPKVESITSESLLHSCLHFKISIPLISNRVPGQTPMLPCWKFHYLTICKTPIKNILESASLF